MVLAGCMVWAGHMCLVGCRGLAERRVGTVHTLEESCKWAEGYMVVRKVRWGMAG